MRPTHGGGMSVGRLRRRTEYITYMQSGRWFAFREAWAERHGGAALTCYIDGCDVTWSDGLDLHHLSYDRLGREADDDLIAMCREHHDLLHMIFRGSRPWRKLGLRSASLGIAARLSLKGPELNSAQ